MYTTGLDLALPICFTGRLYFFLVCSVVLISDLQIGSSRETQSVRMEAMREPVRMAYYAQMSGSAEMPKVFYLQDYYQ
jgi:hypothetical protein